MEQKKRVVIVGAGITGLSAAYRLQELSQEKQIPIEIFVLVDSEKQIGGAIASSSQDGFLLEEGPDSFVSEKPWALNLCKRLGIESEIINTQDRFRKSFVVRKKTLMEVPDGFYLMAPMKVFPFLKSHIFSWFGKIRMGLEIFVPKKKNQNDESLSHFIRRRFGQEALDRIVQPMIGGIYGADPEKLSLMATFPRFLDMEQKHGSVISALRNRKTQNSELRTQNSVSGPRYGMFLSFKQGIQTLVDALREKLPNDCICSDKKVNKIIRNKQNNQWEIHMEGIPAPLEADEVIMATNAHKTGSLLEGLDEALSQKLKSINYGSVVTMSFAFKREDIQHPLNGFGFVVPDKENLSMVGCTFSHMKYEGRAPEGYVLLRAFVGGALQEELLQLNDKDLEEKVLKDLNQLLGVDGKPLFVKTRRFMSSMPHYELGHCDKVKDIESLAIMHEGLYLTGNGYKGIGIPDCIHSGEIAAETIFEKMKG